jgi:hypothetical protein
MTFFTRTTSLATGLALAVTLGAASASAQDMSDHGMSQHRMHTASIHHRGVRSAYREGYRQGFRDGHLTRIGMRQGVSEDGLVSGRSVAIDPVDRGPFDGGLLGNGGVLGTGVLGGNGVLGTGVLNGQGALGLGILGF